VIDAAEEIFTRQGVRFSSIPLRPDANRAAATSKPSCKTRESRSRCARDARLPWGLNLHVSSNIVAGRDAWTDAEQTRPRPQPPHRAGDR